MQPVQLTHMHKVFSDMHCCMFYYNYMRSWRLYSPIFYTKSEVVQKLIDTYRTQHLKKVKKKWNFSMSFCLFALRKWLSLETCLKRRTQKWVTFFDNSTSKNPEKTAKSHSAPLRSLRSAPVGRYAPSATLVGLCGFFEIFWRSKIR